MLATHGIGVQAGRRGEMRLLGGWRGGCKRGPLSGCGGGGGRGVEGVGGGEGGEAEGAGHGGGGGVCPGEGVRSTQRGREGVEVVLEGSPT